MSDDHLQPQTRRVLEWLREHDSLNPLQAWQELGIYRLSAKIDHLRKAGFKVRTDRRVVQNRVKEECHVAFYVLEGNPYQPELF